MSTYKDDHSGGRSGAKISSLKDLFTLNKLADKVVLEH